MIYNGRVKIKMIEVKYGKNYGPKFMQVIPTASWFAKFTKHEVSQKFCLKKTEFYIQISVFKYGTSAIVFKT